MSNQPNNSALASVDEIRATLNGTLMVEQFKAVMPTQKHVDRFVRAVMTAVQNNPDLLQADRRTFYGACMRAAQDGLLPDGKEAVLVIYNVNVAPQGAAAQWVKTAQYQPMVEGMFKKVRLSGEIKGAPKVHVVKENDVFEYELGDNEKLIHKPALSGRGKTIGAYSIVKTKDGEITREFMDIGTILQIRDKSKSKDSGPWKLLTGDNPHSSDFDEMCRKTVFRRHFKRLPKSTDLENVLKADDETFEYEEQQLRNVTPAAPAPPAPAEEGKRRRPRALAKVVETKPAETPATATPAAEPATGTNHADVI